MAKSFEDFNLDDRILKAISKSGWKSPSEVQSKGIPLVLEGNDLIVRAKTGSGKTATYAIPLVQKILKNKKNNCSEESYMAIVLLPSKELSKQAYRNIVDLISYCAKEISVVDLGNVTVQSAKGLISSADILVSTPSKLVAHITNKTVDISTKLKFLVIDEADMIFSLGYEDDLKSIVSHLPKIYQALLVSATLNKDVDSLKGLILHNPVSLKLSQSEIPDDEKLSQFIINCETTDKYLLAYSLFKLNLIKGKNLIFVNSIDKCYRLKLFFEQFYIKACVLNSELPQSSRIHIVDQFNKGVYDTIIATDDAAVIESKQSTKQQKNKKKAEFNVSRGIDFQDVDNVLNFDFPTNVNSYIHRIGRTARGHNSGTALSFVTTLKEKECLQKVESQLKLPDNNIDGVASLKPYNFKLDEIEGLRYRVNDAYNNVTRIKIKDARLKEIKGEILNSSKLKTYFEDNPKDLKVLRHDKILTPTDQHPHMKNIPDYLVPPSLKNIMLKPKRKRKLHIPFHERNKKKVRNDPLKTFKYKNPKKN